jgi:hypothetical protein
MVYNRTSNPIISKYYYMRHVKALELDSFVTF